MTSHQVAIIGAGNMGHGLATQFAIHDQSVTLLDHRQSNLEEARERILDTVEFLNDEDLSSADPESVVDAIRFTLDVADGVGSADIVLETVPEDIDIKEEVFTKLAAVAPSNAILASNTSSIPITELSAFVPEERERVIGCHWWYPPYLLTPVEVIRGEATDASTVQQLSEFVEAVDRDPIHVERDVPGFVWNRVQRAVYRECLYMVEEGIASIDDINRAIRDGYATRTAAIGPFETIDIAGLDQMLAGTKRIQPTLCNDEAPSRLYEEHLERGDGGIEDGRGFLEYNEPPDAIRSARDRKVAAIRRSLENL